MKRVNIAIFVSGGGTNCENLIHYFSGSAKVNCALVVSNKADAYALVRAERLGVPSRVVSREQLKDSSVVMPILQEFSIDFIVLAGFLPLVPDYLLDAYPRRIINIHPALLPKYGGKGMWGHHVHEAVLANGEKESGCTVHLVNEVCDGGEILLQKKVPVMPGDTPDSLYARIAPLEHEALLEGLLILCRKF